jgi:hypothetical protein
VPPAVRADARRAAGTLQRRGDSDRPGGARRGDTAPAARRARSVSTSAAARRAAGECRTSRRP